MSWRARLYSFALREEGQFFGGTHDCWNASALLTGRGGPILVRDQLKPSSVRGMPDDHFALVSTTLELAEGYTLSIKGKSGAAWAYQTLQKWKGLGNKRRSEDDFAPRGKETALLPQRFVRTSHEGFTAQVFKNRDLLNLLEDGRCDTHRIQVAPHAQDARLHLLEVKASLFDESTWGIDSDPLAGNEEITPLLEERNHRFAQRMEAVLQLMELLRQELLRTPVK